MLVWGYLIKVWVLSYSFLLFWQFVGRGWNFYQMNCLAYHSQFSFYSSFFVFVCLFSQCVGMAMTFLVQEHSRLSLQTEYCFFTGWHGFRIVMCHWILKFCFVLGDSKYFPLLLFFSMYSSQRNLSFCASSLLPPTRKLSEVALSSLIYLFKSLLCVSARI